MTCGQRASRKLRPRARQAPPLSRAAPPLGAAPPPPPAVPGGAINAERGPGSQRSRKGQAEHARRRLAARPTAPSLAGAPFIFFLKERLKEKGGESERDTPARGPLLTTNNPLTLQRRLMQMTERRVTKAAARAARAQPAESRDRKYDKHLSYSATWGRSAVRAGSLRGGGGRGVHATPRGFRDGSPGRSRAAASAAGTLPDASVSGLTSDPQTSEWQDGGSSESRG